MRLHVLILALCFAGALAASIPDKKDIEKKLAEVVQEVLNKDKIPIENAASEQELIDQTNGIKDVENNLRKSAQPVGIPVKVVVDDVKPALKSGDKKEDNEVSPGIEESAEIIRPEIDLNNPGLPQHSQHDTQNPEHFEDANKVKVLKNSEWLGSPQYAQLQKEIKELKNSFETKMSELYGSLQAHWATHDEKDEEKEQQQEIKLRASVIRQDASSTSGTNNTTNQWGGLFANLAASVQNGLQQINQTVSGYWNNSTNTSNNQCGGGGANIFNFGQNNGVQAGQGQQSDEQRPPGLWQSVQNFFQGAGGQVPAGAQSDSPQPAQPNRPVIQAFQSLVQNAGNILGGGRPPAQNGSPAQQPAQSTSPQEGSNAVPAESKPEDEAQKEKPVQATAAPQQSGPIKQMIGNNAVVQGIAGAVQRIQQTIIPNKPREDAKNAEENDLATKGGWGWGKPNPGHGGSGDNQHGSSSGIEVKAVPIDSPVTEAPVKEAPAPAIEPTKEEEKAPAEVAKTE